MTRPAHKIEVVDYDPRWPQAFGGYAATLRAALGDLVMSVEHVGSTSVVGLAAKPVIDIDVVISSRLLLEDVIGVLAELHYVHEGNLGVPGREAFGWPQGRRHHLYVCSVDTPNLHNHLVFRDYLRRHPEAVAAYSDLKRRLARQHRENRDAYSEAKTAFIGSVLARAEDAYGFHTLRP